MNDLTDLQARLRNQRPVDWDQLPDFALYMDQVLSYMDRQVIRFDGDDGLTAAMVNNYIKDGLLPRAEGKRYAQGHLAYLTAICMLKQVLSVKETNRLIAMGNQRKGSTQELYAYFCAQLDGALSETAQRLPEECAVEDLPRLALNLALRSYADRLACQRILDILAKTEPQPEKPEKKREKAGK